MLLLSLSLLFILLLVVLVKVCGVCFFFFKQKTAYEMRISDWSSDVCSSDLGRGIARGVAGGPTRPVIRGGADAAGGAVRPPSRAASAHDARLSERGQLCLSSRRRKAGGTAGAPRDAATGRAPCRGPCRRRTERRAGRHRRGPHARTWRHRRRAVRRLHRPCRSPDRTPSGGRVDRPDRKSTRLNSSH